MTVEIVILAMIAALLGLRLYSVLGRRAEHEEEPIQGRGRLEPRPSRVQAPRTVPDTSAGTVAARAQPVVAVAAPQVERGLRDISGGDRRFDAAAFLDGAKGAYRLILEAFWRGDRDTLRAHCDHDVYESFVAAIDAREAAGEVLQNALVRIEDATISEARYQSPMAQITVVFRADIAAVTRSADGTMIAGSLNDAIEVNDAWTFTRNTQSPDPDWVLEATDEG